MKTLEFYAVMSTNLSIIPRLPKFSIKTRECITISRVWKFSLIPSYAQTECRHCFCYLSQLCLQPFEQEPVIFTVRYHRFSETNFITWHHSWVKVKSSITFATFLKIPGTLIPELMVLVVFSGLGMSNKLLLKNLANCTWEAYYWYF